MAKYIDCDAAIALAKDIIVPTKSGHDYRHRCIDPQDLAELPAADVVERKLGSWRHYEGELTCSECSSTIYDDIMSLLGDDVPRFCPNCGAQMIGGDDDV